MTKLFKFVIVFLLNNFKGNEMQRKILEKNLPSQVYNLLDLSTIRSQGDLLLIDFKSRQDVESVHNLMLGAGIDYHLALGLVIGVSKKSLKIF